MKKLFFISALLAATTAFAEEISTNETVAKVTDKVTDIAASTISTAKEIDEEYQVTEKVTDAGKKLTDWFTRAVEDTKEKVKEKESK